MARSRRKSELEGWVDILARLPWQGCAALALVFWFVFHLLAQIDPPKPTTVAGLGAAYLPLVARTFGTYMQVIAPGVCMLAAVLSWFGKRRRKRLLSEAESRSTSAPLAGLTWREFEQLVGAHFERIGYSVTFTPEGADGGVDVVARKGSEMFLVQCKQWRATQVGVSVVRELFGLIAARGASGGYVVSIGPFTADARSFAEGRNIELVDAHALLRTAQAVSRPISPAPHTVRETRASEAPACPKCGSKMIRRVAKQGANQGQAFFGCSTYPNCRSTLPA